MNAQQIAQARRELAAFRLELWGYMRSRVPVLACGLVIASGNVWCVLDSYASYRETGHDWPLFAACFNTVTAYAILWSLSGAVLSWLKALRGTRRAEQVLDSCEEFLHEHPEETP